MSQAKMWEAIQEANREMTIQKNDRNNNNMNAQNQQKFSALAFNSQQWRAAAYDDFLLEFDVYLCIKIMNTSVIK